jgi:pimeloyl-ACP methyl ester carboxylesterase
MSSEGSYAVTQQVVNFGTSSYVFYSFYDLRGDTPQFAGLVSTVGQVTKTMFSPSEMEYIIVKQDRTIVIYNIGGRSQRTLQLDQTELPFLSVSERANYLSTYNYVTETHKIWNTNTGALIETPGAPNLVEFSEDESEAAYLIKNGNFNNLSTIQLDGTNEVTSAASGDFLVEDYIYLGNTLYYLANRNNPLEWSLYGAEGGGTVAEDVSYNVYLSRYGDRIVYGKINGKNTDLYTYGGAEHTKLNAAPPSSLVSSLTREVKNYGNAMAVEVMPEDIDRGDLYIWLHGGPRRQTSIGYHPYLSYAVFDELLEDIAAAGNYVVKLDYSGSWGYGDAFMETLNGNVGRVEINDVERVIDAFTDEHQVQNVYLIGNSYGGYMAFRGLNALTNDVDGIISINGVADWYGLVQAIPSSPFKDLFGGVPDLNTLPLYLTASAFTNYEDIDDQPMLVIYGSEDKTVPAGQSRQYAEFMEEYDKNVNLLELTGAEHVITRRENLIEMCEAVRDIFEDDLNCEA